MVGCSILIVLVFLRALFSPLVADVLYQGPDVKGNDVVININNWGVSMWMLLVLAVVCPVVSGLMMRK